MYLFMYTPVISELGKTGKVKRDRNEDHLHLTETVLVGIFNITLSTSYKDDEDYINYYIVYY